MCIRDSVYPAIILLNGGPDVTADQSPFGMTFNQVSVWFGIIVVKMAEVCLITPPIGLNCFVVAGGGETISAINKFISTKDISYCSTAGGAFLEFVEGKELPSLEALGFKKEEEKND